MRIDNHLPKGVPFITWRVSIGRNILQQLEHHRYASGVNSIFRFFQAKQAAGLPVKLHHGQGQKAQCSIRKIARRVNCSIACSHLQGESFAGLIAVNNYFTNIFQKLRQTIGHLCVHRAGLGFIRLAVAICLWPARQMLQRRGHVRPVGTHARRRREFDPDGVMRKLPIVIIATIASHGVP